MGDLPPGSVPQPLDTTAAGLAHDEHQMNNPSSSSLRSSSNNAPFYSQLNSLSHGQSRPELRSPGHATNPHFLGQESGVNATPLNLGAMAGALPDYGLPDNSGNVQAQQQVQRPLSGASTSALVYQLGQNLQISGHGSPSHSPYAASYGPGQFQHNFVPPQGTQHPTYGPFSSNQQRLTVPSSMQHQFQNYPQPSQYLYYPSPYGPQSQYPQGFPAPVPQSQPMYGRRPSLPSSQMAAMGQNLEMTQHEGGYSPAGRHFGNIQGDGGPTGSILTSGFLPQGIPPRGPSSLIPRGPPRKPKQSGHALWVGNLPPGTTVLQLKDHFSRDATKDIESLFLISKSNCAFVNYRTETSCTAAMHRFHDSRFNGVRLVCRLRRSSAPASGLPTGPSAMVGSQPVTASPPKSPQLAESDEAPPEDEVESPHRLSGEESRQTSNAAVKYFIVKSLTLQDLELSVRNGIWATQSHNEHVLNKAFEAADHVYLIFSANKSGEYFGYARMASPILEDAAHLIGAAPQPENILESPDVPKSIPTAATEWAPKGRIIDDSARGTIFWEAQLSESETEEGDMDKQEAVEIVEGDASVAQSWGKPFRIEWISTNRLPFYRTRGLRNPWNANREVKIARDGTELETSVGERLIQMFHRLGPSSAGAPMMQPPQLGAPQMRPY